jgi:hypothetical protein
VSKVNSDGTINVDFDDGDKDRFVDPASFKILGGGGGSDTEDDQRSSSKKGSGLRAGEKVKAQFKGKGRFYPGKIVKENRNGTYNVLFDDGDKDNEVELASIERIAGTSSRDASDTEGGGKFEVGSKVEARYKGKTRYYPGRIARVRLNGTYDVDYDDGEKEASVAKDLIKSFDGGGGGNSTPKRSNARSDTEGGADGGALEKGMEVEAKYRGDEWLPGVIKMARPGDVYDVNFDNGKFESRIRRDLIRTRGGGGRGSETRRSRARSPDDFATVESPTNSDDNNSPRKRFVVGQKVEARFKGKGKFYGAKIARVRLNGNVDVNYDDGDKELDVDISNVKAVEQPPATASKSRVRRGSFANADTRVGGGGGARSNSPEGRSPRRRLDDID